MCGVDGVPIALALANIAYFMTDIMHGGAKFYLPKVIFSMHGFSKGKLLPRVPKNWPKCRKTDDYY